VEQTLELENRDLKRVLEETVVQLCNERKKKARIETKTTKITANIRALKQVAESLQPKPEQLKDNERLAKRIEDKRQKWRQHKGEFASTITDLKNKRDELSETEKNYQLQIDDRTALIEQLEAKVERRERQIGDLEQTLIAKSDEEQRLASELHQIKTESEQLKAKSQSLKDALKQNAAQLASNRKRFEKEKEKLSTAKYRMKQLQISFAEKLRGMREEGEQETKARLEEFQKIDAQRDEELRRHKKSFPLRKKNMNWGTPH
jgi:chromosome segregation ATPase